MGMQNTLTVKNNEINQVNLPENQREYGAMGPFEYPYKRIVDLLCEVFPKTVSTFVPTISISLYQTPPICYITRFKAS